MKRGTFKRKTLEEVKGAQAKKRERIKKAPKRSKLASKASKTKKGKKPRKKKAERRKLEDKIWAECKRIIRARYPNECYTCNATGLEGSNWQTGHGKPKGALPLQFKYDLRNLKPQCMNCNIHLGGASDIFITKLENEIEGLHFLKEACLYDEGWIIHKGNSLVGKEATEFLRELLEKYKDIV